MADENPSCFTWCVSFKKACNKRWARFRNNIRKRFYARRGQALDPAALLNESGTKDMYISKTKYKSNKVVPLTTLTTVKEVPVIDDNMPKAIAGEDFDELVEEYVSKVIKMTADTIKSTERQSLPSNAKITEDNASLTSSVISQIADSAVTESLTNIVLDSNQSAERPRTIREFMESFGIADDDTAPDGMPSVCV